jgi:hypothetical protein
MDPVSVSKLHYRRFALKVQNMSEDNPPKKNGVNTKGSVSLAVRNYVFYIKWCVCVCVCVCGQTEEKKKEII